MTIYAQQPFSLSSQAILDLEPEDDSEETPLPESARQRGLAYLTEVSVAVDVIEELRSDFPAEPSASMKLKAVLHYEEYDVYM